MTSTWRVLAFSLLPDIGRARYRWLILASVVDQTFTSGGVDLHVCLFNDHHHVSFFLFLCVKFFAVGLDCEIISTVKPDQHIYHLVFFAYRIGGG